MVQAHSPGAFFPLSNQRVTLRSQLQLQVYFYGQYGQHLWFAWEFEVQPNVLRSSERREIDMKSSPVEKK